MITYSADLVERWVFSALMSSAFLTYDTAIKSTPSDIPKSMSTQSYKTSKANSNVKKSTAKIQSHVSIQNRQSQRQSMATQFTTD